MPDGARMTSSPDLAAAKTKSALFEVDLSKPLVFQVGHLLDRYDDWVHKPIISKTGPRLFESDYMELLTNTCWWAIPALWVPVAIFAEWKALSLGVKLSYIPPLMLLGLFIWTSLEYCLHRFIFHWHTEGYWTNTLHYLLHGCHHKHPQDPYRLVFPPALCAVFISILVPPFCLILPIPWVWAGFGGGLLGYVAYDCTHFWVHFSSIKFEPFSSLRSYHMGHHYKNPELAYGITSPLWDLIVGTYPRPQGSASKDSAANK